MLEFRIFVGGQRVQAVPPDDRGLAYGDALFETMRAHRGELPWWDRHWARLHDSAMRLQMPLPDASQVLREALGLIAGRDAVLKLQLTRGSGGRGYAPPSKPEPLWLLSLHPLPAQAAALDAIWCETRLARQPLLAGMKHGNRLEQVLARAEVAQAGADEGVVRDVAGRVTSGTASNLFMLDGEGWHTPELDHAGVAGICRGWVIEQTGAAVRRIRVDEVERAGAVFLCNSVRGILPVQRLGARAWPQIQPEVRALQSMLAQAHPGFATPTEAS